MAGRWKRRRTSNVPMQAVEDDEQNRHGCVHDLIHSLDFNQRFRIRKMLAHKRRGHGKLVGSVGRTKSPKMKQGISTCGVHGSMDANSVVEDKPSVRTGSSGKAILSTQNSASSSEQDHEQNISPLALRLLRSISMHRRKGSDYVDNISPQSENSTAEQTLYSSAYREHIPFLFKASDGSTFHMSSEETTIDIASQSKNDELSDQLLEMESYFKESLSEAMEALPKQNGSRELENDVSLHQPTELLDMIMILRSNMELSLKLLNDSSVVANYVHSQHISPPEQMLGKLSSFPVAGSSFRKNDVIKPQKSETSPELECQSKSLKDDQTVSGRFKIIRKRIKDVIKDNRKEGHRISMDGVLHKIPYGRNMSKDVKKAKQALSNPPASDLYDTDKNRSVKRSHSLSESLDKYSRLFESISRKESERIPELSELDQEDALDGGKRPKTLGRIFSLPEFETSLTKDVRYRALDLYNFGEAKRIEETFVHAEEDVKADSVEKAIDLDVGKAVYECQEQPVLRSNEQDTCEVCDVSEGLTGEGSSDSPLYKEETEEEFDPSDKLTKPTPTFDSEDPILTNQENELDIEDSAPCEASIADPSHIIEMLTDLDDDMLWHVQVDEKDEADFNYVRDVLQKSGRGVDEQADYTGEAETRTDAPKMSLEHHRLLFDVINEVLSEIYDSSFASCPWLSCFGGGPRVRPMPVGHHHILEKVWGKVIGYLKHESLGKNGGWLELQYNCEYVGLELEDLILQDLIDELVLQLGDSLGP